MHHACGTSICMNAYVLMAIAVCCYLSMFVVTSYFALSLGAICQPSFVAIIWPFTFFVSVSRYTHIVGEAHDCFDKGKKYMPINMKGQARAVEQG